MFSPLKPEDPQEVGGYRLRAKLGAGGMGQVYLSFAPSGRPVAVKVIRQEYAENKDFRLRFAHEVRAATRVPGVYTAPVVDSGPEAPTPWLASTFVCGPTLSDAVRDAGALPVPTVLSLVAAVAQALGAIHSAGVVHRDLTPRNIILAADGPYVIDFGIARAADATLVTLSQTPVGTPSFMSPEQVRGEAAGPPSDVYVLGAIAYFAAAGRTAFGEGNPMSVLLRVSEGKADLTGCPPELRDLVQRCLAVDPAARPTTAEVVQACGGPRDLGADWLPAKVIGMVTAGQKAMEAVRARPAEPVLPRSSPAIPVKLVVTAAAAVLLVGAIGGVVLSGAFGGPKRERGGDPSDAYGPTDGTSANTQAQSTPTSPRPSPTPAQAKVLWTGPIRINGLGIDLDQVPPLQDQDSDDDLQMSNAANPVTIKSENFTGGLAVWTESGNPTREKCAVLVSTVGVTYEGVRAGDVLCVATDEWRIATITVTKTTSNFTDGVSATVTVWAEPWKT